MGRGPTARTGAGKGRFEMKCRVLELHPHCALSGNVLFLVLACPENSLLEPALSCVGLALWGSNLQAPLWVTLNVWPQKRLKKLGVGEE